MKDVCTCPLRPGMTYDEILNEIYIGPLDPKTGTHISQNCCSSQRCKKGWICSNLDKAMREADVDRQRRKWYTKRLRAQGLTNEEIAKTSIRRRASRSHNVTRGRKVEFNFDD